MANLHLPAPAAEWRSRFGRVEVHFDEPSGRLTIFLFPQAWTLEEAVSRAVHFREEMNRLLVGWEFGGKTTILSFEAIGGVLAIQWSGARQGKQQLRPLEEEWAQLKTLFPPIGRFRPP